METETQTSSSISVSQGQVKWFNLKTGFGFISLEKGNDIFVHHSSIRVVSEQYRYLVQGEYVQFELQKLPEGTSKHEYQAVNVTGINGGKLMCELRNAMREKSRPLKRSSDENEGYRVVSKKRVLKRRITVEDDKC